MTDCSTFSLSSTLFQKNISDQNVLYTGPSITSLGICNGMSLTMVEATILNYLINFSTGVGINLPNIDLTTCALFTEYITCCNTNCTDLACLMNIVFQSLCILYNDYTTLNTAVTALLSGPYNTGCLTGLTSNPTLTQIIQALITQYCTLYAQVQNLSTAVTSISTGLNTSIGTFLATALQSCQSTTLVKSGTGSTFTATFKGGVPIGTIFPYVGPTSGLFDGTGLGISGTDACGYAFANGNNGTFDFRGFVPVGAINGMGGGTLNPIVVDAGASPSAVYSVGDTVGQIRHELLSAEIPSVGIGGSGTATITPCSINVYPIGGYAPGDQHGGVNNGQAYGGMSFTSTGAGGPVNINCTTISNTVTISGTTNGGGGLHENRQPSKAVYFIQRIS